MGKTVSVIICTYKGARYLNRAIDSVLSQTYKSIELIVVDDNEPVSKERAETEKVMESYKRENIIYVKHPRNKKGAAARNTGIAHSTGDFVCFLDDDDFLLQSRVARSVMTLEQNTDYDGVYCGVIIANNDNIEGVVRAKKPLTQKELLLNEMAIGTGSNIFVTKEAVNQVQGFDEKFKRHQDIEFMLRVLENFKIIELDQLLIVKATNGVDNVPEYIGLLEVKNLYLNKFKKMIDLLDEHDKKQFLCNQYSELFFSAAASGNKEFIKRSIQDLKKYRNITPKDKLLLLFIRHKNSQLKIYQEIKPLLASVKKNLISIKIAKSIDLQTKEGVYKILR